MIAPWPCDARVDLSESVEIASLHDAESQRLAEHMAGIAREMSGCEGIDRFQESGWLPERFFALLDELYAAYDAYIAHNLGASGLNVRCRFGCTRCCHQIVHGVYAFEIINLYRNLRVTPAEFMTCWPRTPRNSRRPPPRSPRRTTATAPIRSCAPWMRSLRPRSRVHCWPGT